MDDWLINRTLDNIQIRGMGGEEAEAPQSFLPSSESDGTPGHTEADTSLDNIDEVHASEEIYKKRPLRKEDSTLEVPYVPLTGESPLFLGAVVDGTICLSDYRLYVSVNPLFNIPLGLIEQVECRDICNLYIYCKDARTFRCSFADGATCQKWLGYIQDEMRPKRSLELYFAFVFYSWNRDEQKDLYLQLNQRYPGVPSGNDSSDIPQIYLETSRMGFDCERHWRISEINMKHDLCPSYPQRLIVPRSISDEVLKLAAAFRYSLRIPAVVWRHKKNGSVIARCSQPKVGWFGSRSKEDEMLIQAIVEACFQNPGIEQPVAAPIEDASLPCELGEKYSLLASSTNPLGQSSVARKVLVIDARSYTVAVANRAKGGGSENTNYENCEVMYQGLPNIHSIRKSFQSLRILCASAPDPTVWLSSLESTCWLQYIGALINAAQVVVTAIDAEQRTVLVHCSDGWDRTPQIVALAELMLDPYYRSKKGFQILVEREWLDFGHKFADRCGNGIGSEDPNERCPVFLQWLDCVYQLLSEFPCHFEFNEQYLVKLAYHTYSCLFGTFLCNTDYERERNSVRMRSFSIWSHLNENPVFHNNLYNESSSILRLPGHAYKIKFWNEVYFPSPFLSSGILNNHDHQEHGNGGKSLVKAKSCDDIASIGHSCGRQRRASDTNAVDVELVRFNEQRMERDSASNLDVDLEDSINLDCGNSASNQSSPSRRTSSRDLPQPVHERPTYPDSGNPVVGDKPSMSADRAAYSDILFEYVPTAVMDSTNGGEASTSDNASENIDCIDPLLHKRILEFLLEEKNSSGSCSYSCGTPHHSRTPSSGFPGSPCDEPLSLSVPKDYAVPHHVFDIDGSVISYNEIQTQVQKLVHELKGEVKKLQKEVSSLIDFKNKIYEFIRVKNGLGMKDDAANPADSTALTELQNSPDEGFVKVDLPKIVLWVPDHLASTCTRCRSPFSTINRKHHCRRCGLVFCSACTPHRLMLPMQRLFYPVRVCEICHSQLERQCRHFVESCDRLSKPVIAAASN